MDLTQMLDDELQAEAQRLISAAIQVIDEATAVDEHVAALRQEGATRHALHSGLAEVHTRLYNRYMLVQQEVERRRRAA